MSGQTAVAAPFFAPFSPLLKRALRRLVKVFSPQGACIIKIEVKLKPRGAKNCGWASSKKLWWCPIPTTCGTTPVRPLLCGWQLHEGQEHRLLHGMKSATKAEWTDEQFPSRMWSQNNWAAVEKKSHLYLEGMRLGLSYKAVQKRERQRGRIVNELVARGGANLSDG